MMAFNYAPCALRLISHRLVLRTLPRRYFLLLMSALFLTGTAIAQIPSESNVTSTPVPDAGHDYIHDLTETVNPANGSLSIRIQIPLPPGRGFTLPFSIAYDSNGTYYLSSPCPACNGIVWETTESMLAEGGWSYTVPMLSVQEDSFDVQTVSPKDVAGNFVCNGLTNFVMQDPTGSRRNLGLAYYNTNQNCQNPGLGGQAVTVTSATEGSLLAQTTAAWIGEGSGDIGKINPVTVTDADGTTYGFASARAPGVAPWCGPPACEPTTYPPYYVADRKGNAYSISYSTTSHTNPAVTYTDSVGRTALSIPTFQSSPDQVTVSGYASPYRINWTTVQANFTITLTPLEGQTCGGPGSQPSVQAISSIVLPNGKEFTFDYKDNPYGLVDRITYPSGGYVRYVWGVNPQAEYGQWPIFSGASGGGSYVSGACPYHYDTPAILSRYVSFDGTNEVLEQDFSYSTCWVSSNCPGTGIYSQWLQKTATVITKDKVRGTQYETAYVYQPVFADVQPAANEALPAQIPAESEINYYDINGKLVETVEKVWKNERVLTRETTTVATSGTSQVKETDWTYDNNEMVTEKDDYDYGAGKVGPILRKTVYGNPSASPPVPAYETFAAHIVDKPTLIHVLNGNGTTLAGVTYRYDGYGDPQARADWLSSDGGTTATTTYTYDLFKNLGSVTDPAGNVTIYSYGSNGSTFVDQCPSPSPSGYGAYITNIRYPSTNGVAHEKSFQYYCASGKLAESKDESGNVTNYKYDSPPSGCGTPDGLDRLSEIDYPDGGKETLCYADGVYNGSPGVPNTIPSVTTSVSMTSTVSKTTVAAMDGLGHEIWDELTSDPQGSSYIQTIYDGNGEIWKVSEPSYSPSQGMIYTASSYDALSRRTSQTNPDGTVRQWCYNGLADGGQTNCLANKGTESTPLSLSAFPWVDVSDEKGSHWQQISDSLGRLVAVIEPNASNVPALETDYQYDVLGNLTQVDQWGGAYGSNGDRQRFFSYDNLSRLLMAWNPESGLTSYSYSVNGSPCAGDTSLPCSKTDARGVTTNYSYDALNRLTSKYYTGDSSGTPTACYAYDTAGGFNSIGLLSSEWTQKANPSAGANQCGGQPTYLTLRSILSYDSMGRILKEQQCTPSGCTGGGPYTLSYQYDLAGNLTYSTNGLATTPGATSPLTFNEFYDGAGRLQQVSSGTTWTNAATHPGTLFSAQPGTGACGSTAAFAPFGGLQNAVYGNGLAINRSFDQRNRTDCESDTGKLVVNATPSTATVTVTGAEQSR